MKKDQGNFKNKNLGEIPDSWESLKKPNPVQQGSASHQRSHSKNLGKEKHYPWYH